MCPKASWWDSPRVSFIRTHFFFPKVSFFSMRHNTYIAYTSLWRNIKHMPSFRRPDSQPPVRVLSLWQWPSENSTPWSSCGADQRLTSTQRVHQGTMKGVSTTWQTERHAHFSQGFLRLLPFSDRGDLLDWYSLPIIWSVAHRSKIASCFFSECPFKTKQHRLAQRRTTNV